MATLLQAASGGRKLKRDWYRELDATRTTQGVLQVVEEFIESRSDIYWSGVPEALRRPTIATELQLQQWHHAIVQAISAMPSPGSPMQELAVLSLRAAVRVHQIRLHDHAPSETASSDDDGGMKAAPARRVRSRH